MHNSRERSAKNCVLLPPIGVIEGHNRARIVQGWACFIHNDILPKFCQGVLHRIAERPSILAAHTSLKLCALLVQPTPSSQHDLAQGAESGAGLLLRERLVELLEC